jgi:hypothetical protein
MKNDFNFMKTKFSPNFLSRMEKSIQSLQTINYDMEVLKMNMAQAAQKKEVADVESRLKNYTPKNNFLLLETQCKEYALNKDMIKLGHEIKYTAH